MWPDEAKWLRLGKQRKKVIWEINTLLWSPDLNGRGRLTEEWMTEGRLEHNTKLLGGKIYKAEDRKKQKGKPEIVTHETDL